MLRKSFNVFIVYFLIFSATALVFNYFTQNGFGSGDFLPLLVWGSPSILVNSIILTFALEILKDKRLTLVIPIKTTLFFLLPYGGVFSYVFLLGPWFGALSVPPMPPHLAATLSVLCFQNEKSVKGTAINSLLAVAAVFFFGTLFSPSVKKFSVIALQGGNVPFSSAVQVKKYLEPEEVVRHYCPSNYPTLADIEKADRAPSILTGRFCQIEILKFLLDFYRKTGLVFNTPLWHRQTLAAHFDETRASVLLLYEKEYTLPSGGVSLPVPRSGSVIYYSQGGTWKSFPEDPSPTKRHIRISSGHQEAQGKREPILCVSITDYFGDTRGPNCAGALPRGVKLTLETDN